MASFKVLSHMFKQDGFECKTSEYGWDIKFTDDNEIIHTMSIDFKVLSKESCKESVLGYVRCLAFQEGWLKINDTV